MPSPPHRSMRETSPPANFRFGEGTPALLAERRSGHRAHYPHPAGGQVKVFKIRDGQWRVEYCGSLIATIQRIQNKFLIRAGSTAAEFGSLSSAVQALIVAHDHTTRSEK